MDILSAASATREQLGLLMLGMNPQETKSQSSDPLEPSNLARVH
jgi:hypothetical protein